MIINSKRILVMLPVILLLFTALLSGCGRAETTGESDSRFPITLTDDLGRQVTINEVPQRIVSLAPANTEILFALGLDEKVVGVTKFCEYPPGATKKPKIGGFSNPSAELVVGANPDLVLATGKHKEFINQIESAGLKVVAIEDDELSGIMKNIKLVGKITGASQQAGELVSSMQQRIDAVVSKVSKLSEKEKPSVYFEIWPDPLTTGGPGSLLHSLITTAGGKNIAGEVEKDWVTLNEEFVLARNPDVIITSYHGSAENTMAQVEKRKGWENIAAVKSNRVYNIENKDVVQLAGPRIVDGLELIAGILHPEFFDSKK